jgi:hypothetical protein
LTGTVFLQAGYALITDDMLALRIRDDRYVASPGLPQLRLWPDQAERLIDGGRTWPFVHPSVPKCRIPVGRNGVGTSVGGARPLRCIFVPERQHATTPGLPIQLRPLSPVDALKELQSKSYDPIFAEVQGLQQRRFLLLGELVRRVPVRRLCYSEGLEHLPAVMGAVLKEVDGARVSLGRPARPLSLNMLAE